MNYMYSKKSETSVLGISKSTDYSKNIFSEPLKI